MKKIILILFSLILSGCTTLPIMTKNNCRERLTIMYKEYNQLFIEQQNKCDMKNCFAYIMGNTDGIFSEQTNRNEYCPK